MRLSLLTRRPHLQRVLAHYGVGQATAGDVDAGPNPASRQLPFDLLAQPLAAGRLMIDYPARQQVVKEQKLVSLAVPEFSMHGR